MTTTTDDVPGRPLVCAQSPDIEGDLPKRWNGRPGVPCDGPVQSRATLYGPGTIDRCDRHWVEAQAWKADLEVRAAGAAGQPSVDLGGPELSPRAREYAAVKARAQAALAAVPVRLADCTHGGDCPVHPDTPGVHNFDPSAVEALAAVLVQVRYLPVTEATLRKVVAVLGLDWQDVERAL